MGFCRGFFSNGQNGHSQLVCAHYRLTCTQAFVPFTPRKWTVRRPDLSPRKLQIFLKARTSTKLPALQTSRCALGLWPYCPK